MRYVIVLRNLLAQFQREETQLFVLRVMVGLVILYDHVHPQGAFVKGSNVDVSINVYCYVYWKMDIFNISLTSIDGSSYFKKYFKNIRSKYVMKGQNILDIYSRTEITSS